MTLTQQQLQQITRKVYQQMPDLKGVVPVVSTQTGPLAKTGPTAVAQQRYLLTFTQQTRLPNGSQLNRVVRVVASGNGKVIKISASR